MFNKLTILHIAKVESDASNGVHMVVPKIISEQQKIANVNLLNIANNTQTEYNNWLRYTSPFSISSLPTPFNHPDIVVFHEVYRYEYLEISRHLRRQQIPYLILPHGCLTSEAQRKGMIKKHFANLFFYNNFISNATAIQCLSESECENVRGNKKFVAPSGITLPDVHKTVFSQNEIKIIYIGRLDIYYKGLDLLIASVHDCKRQLCEYNCKIYLYGPDKKGRHQKIKKLIARHNLDDIIVLNPGVFGKEKEQVLLEADYFIQTSRSEGLPLGILEALSYGIPCIVTNGTRVADIIEDFDAGWWCEVSKKKISETLIKAVEEYSFLPTKSKNALNLISNRFVWDIVTKNTVEKYRKICSFSADSGGKL